MPTIQHETTVAAPIMQIWSFFMDPVRNLPRLGSREDAIVIESADLPIREGSVIVIAARDPLGRRIRWESRIESIVMPQPTISGMEGRFIDTQLKGPFAAWTHSHEFEAIESKTTRIVDRVTYKPPMGILGPILDWLFIRWKVRSMLRQRARSLRIIFGS